MSIFDIFIKKKPIDAPWAKFYTKEEINYPIPDMTMYDEVKEESKATPTLDDDDNLFDLIDSMYKEND